MKTRDLQKASDQAQARLTAAIGLWLAGLNRMALRMMLLKWALLMLATRIKPSRDPSGYVTK